MSTDVRHSRLAAALAITVGIVGATGVGWVSGYRVGFDRGQSARTTAWWQGMETVCNDEQRWRHNQPVPEWRQFRLHLVAGR